MKVNKKGQWMSLDFLLAMILIVLSIGMLLQFMETKSYSLKEESIDLELQRVGETAANLLVSSPDIVCELADVRQDASGNPSKILAYINNCITVCEKNQSNPTKCKKEPPNDKHWGWFKNHSNTSKGLFKHSFGLGDEFECKIEITGLEPNETFATDCADNIPTPTPKNIYSTKRKIVLSDLNDQTFIPKNEFLNCINTDTCNAFTAETLTLWVWRKYE